MEVVGRKRKCPQFDPLDPQSYAPNLDQLFALMRMEAGARFPSLLFSCLRKLKITGRLGKTRPLHKDDDLPYGLWTALAWAAPRGMETAAGAQISKWASRPDDTHRLLTWRVKFTPTAGRATVDQATWSIKMTRHGLFAVGYKVTMRNAAPSPETRVPGIPTYCGKKRRKIYASGYWFAPKCRSLDRHANKGIPHLATEILEWLWENRRAHSHDRDLFTIAPAMATRVRELLIEKPDVPFTVTDAEEVVCFNALIWLYLQGEIDLQKHCHRDYDFIVSYRPTPCKRPRTQSKKVNGLRTGGKDVLDAIVRAPPTREFQRRLEQVSQAAGGQGFTLDGLEQQFAFMFHASVLQTVLGALTIPRSRGISCVDTRTDESDGSLRIFFRA